MKNTPLDRNRSIKFCPNCRSGLSDSKELGQGVKECKICDTRFFILVTSTNSIEIEKRKNGIK